MVKDRTFQPPRCRKVSRIVYEETHGVFLSTEEQVCHRCDNTKCVEPLHFFLGTHQDNVDDMVSKTRQKRGRAMHTNKLTEQQALEIWRSSGNLYELAAEYEISISAVRDIKSQRSWRWLTQKQNSGSI